MGAGPEMGSSMDSMAVWGEEITVNEWKQTFLFQKTDNYIYAVPENELF